MVPCRSAIASLRRSGRARDWVARSVAARYSQPVRYFCPTDLRKSSEANSARSIGLMSVPALVNSAASLAISSRPRGVGHEVPGERGRDRPGRRRVVRQVADQAVDDRDALLRVGVRVPPGHHLQRPAVAHVRVELHGQRVPVDRQPGQRVRGLHDVEPAVVVGPAGDRVQRADAEQLQQLAAEVLVDRRPAVLLLRVAVGLRLVQVDQHRRVEDHRLEHVAELAEGVLAHHVPVVRRRSAAGSCPRSARARTPSRRRAPSRTAG